MTLGSSRACPGRGGWGSSLQPAETKGPGSRRIHQTGTNRILDNVPGGHFNLGRSPDHLIVEGPLPEPSGVSVLPALPSRQALEGTNLIGQGAIDHSEVVNMIWHHARHQDSWVGEQERGEVPRQPVRNGWKAGGDPNDDVDCLTRGVVLRRQPEGAASAPGLEARVAFHPSMKTSTRGGVLSPLTHPGRDKPGRCLGNHRSCLGQRPGLSRPGGGRRRAVLRQPQRPVTRHDSVAPRTAARPYRSCRP